MGKQVVLLKDHANFLAKFEFVEVRIVDFPAVDPDGTGINVIQCVDAADQG